MLASVSILHLFFYSEMCKIKISSKNNLVHFRHGSQVRIVSLFRHSDTGAQRTRPGSEFDNHGISWYTEQHEKWNTLRQILVDWLTWHAWIKPIPKWPPCCTTGECFMAKIRIVLKWLFVRASTNFYQNIVFVRANAHMAWHPSWNWQISIKILPFNSIKTIV